MNEQDKRSYAQQLRQQSYCVAYGTYGQCTDCGEAISAARLQVSPEAARCISCQQAAERSIPAI